jgi:two-component system cell cycle response regulator DivK
MTKIVLLVEDNELNLKLLNDILEYHGFIIIATNLGKVALELACQHMPNLILMDMQLPDISGIEAARHIKADEQTCTIPIIAVTAFTMPGERSKILKNGCDACVSKPFNILEVPKISECFQSQRRR